MPLVLHFRATDFAGCMACRQSLVNPQNHSAYVHSRLSTGVLAWVVHQVSFPGVGELVRNRAGRIEFVFEQQLVEALELGLAPVSQHTHVS